MPIMYPSRPKGRAINVHPSQVDTMTARGWRFEPADEGQRVEAPAKLTAAERQELRAVLGDALDRVTKLTGDQRDAIRAGATYEPARTPRRRSKRKDAT